MPKISRIKLPGAEIAYDLSTTWDNISNKPDFKSITVEVENEILNINENNVGNLAPAQTTAGITDELKIALLQFASNVAYSNENGQGYYNTLEKALYENISLSSISAYYNNSNKVYNNDNVNNLKQNLIVKTNYSNGHSGITENYTLSGTLSTGLSTITVEYDGKSTTFDVEVTANPTLYVTFAKDQHTVYSGDSLDSLRPYMTVFVNEKNKNYAAICDYTLSGSLTTGTQTITVYYGGSTQTFSVNVVEPRSFVSIIPTLNLNGNIIRTNNTINDLKSYLTVTANYSDNTSVSLNANDYTLSGSMALAENHYDASTNTFTVSYENLTESLEVKVYAETVLDKIELPTGYTQLTMIKGHSFEDGAYIDTGVLPTEVNRVKYAVQPGYLQASYAYNWSVLSSDRVAYPYFRQGTSGAKNFQIRYNSTTSTGLAETWEPNANYVIETSYPSLIKINNIVSDTTAVDGGSTSTRNLCFFCKPNPEGGYGSVGTVKLFYAEFYDNNDQLIHYYVPCKNEQDVVGLYDTIGEQFYSSNAVREFTAGEVLE